MTTGSKAGTAPKKKSGKTNQRAIFVKAEKFEGELPVKKSGGRKSLLAPLVEQIKAEPDTWFRIAHGLTGTVGQTRTRLAKLDSALEVETRRDPDDEKKSFCYARFVTPKA